MFITFMQQSESIEIFVNLLKKSLSKMYSSIVFVETFGIESVCVIGLTKQRFIEDFNLAKYTSITYYNKDFVFTISETDDRIKIIPHATSMVPASVIIRRYEKFLSSKYKVLRSNSLTYGLDILCDEDYQTDLFDLAKKVFYARDRETFVTKNSLYSPKFRMIFELEKNRGSFGNYFGTVFKIL